MDGERDNKGERQTRGRRERQVDERETGASAEDMLMNDFNL